MKGLDLFCGGGGCTVGYQRAGYDTWVGVDVVPQPDYPAQFVLANAIEILKDVKWCQQFDLIHASPPCPAYSQTRFLTEGHPRLLVKTRYLLQQVGVPYVIENVERAEVMYGTLLLCGSMFGLRTYRHRRFETSVPVSAPEHPKHKVRQTKMGRQPMPDQYMSVVGNFAGAREARDILGVHWMSDRKSVANAIPPVYTKFLGEQMLKATA